MARTQRFFVTPLALLITLGSQSCIKDDIKPAKLPPIHIPSLPGPAPAEFNSESDLPSNFNTTIRAFYDTGSAGTFVTPGDPHPNKIAYRQFIKSGATATVVLLPGRTESIAKYAELAYDLNRQGYSIAILSHRGQGESDHLVSNDPTQSQFFIGHIDSYRQYVADLDYFLNSVVDPDHHHALYLLAHSMGGGIGALYEYFHPGRFKAMVLSAPMMEINTSPYGASVGLTLAQTFCNAGSRSAFSIGQSVYKENPAFNPVDSNTDNQVTHSAARFDLKVQLYTEFPRTKLGGVSNGWLCEWLGAGTPLLRKNGASNATPTLLFQAGNDFVVNAGGQNQYCQTAKNCQIEKFPAAYHEILQETDDIRNLALSYVVKWFKRFP